MYFIPGYVEYEKNKNAIIVTSHLKQNTIEIDDPHIIQEFESIIKKGYCEKLETELTNFLHEQEMLLTKAEVEETLTEVKSLMSNRLIITMMPTEACNFQCPYCYETHKKEYITKEYEENIREFISKKILNFNWLHISWFGGEPTLCKDFITSFSKYIFCLQERYHFQYTSSMTTNGYLLTAVDFVDYYNSGIRSYQITIDGMEHDRTRPLVSGNGSFEKIIANIKELTKLPEDYHFVCILRRNILDGDLDFRWYDYLKSIVGDDSRFKVAVRSVSDWGGEGIGKLKVLSGDKKKSQVKIHENYIDSIKLCRLCDRKELFSRICYASFPFSYIFRPNGNVEKCTVALGNPKNIIGKNDKNKGICLQESVNREWYISELLDQCYTCKDVLSCLNLSCKYEKIICGKKDQVCSQYISR